MRVHRGVASVQEHEVPGEKEWGPQHRVRDFRSQVESSNSAIYQDRAMRLETKGEVEKNKTKKKPKKTETHSYIMDIHNGPEFIKPLKSKRENGTETTRKAVPQIYFISNNPFCPNEINNLSYKFLL